MTTELTPRELTAELAALKSRLAGQEEVVQRALSIASHHAPEHFFEGNDALRPHIAVRHNSGATEVGRRPRLNFLDGTGTAWTLAEGTTEGEDEIDITLAAHGGLGFCYDYLVDSGYTGTEGATVSIPGTSHTFKKYSEPIAAALHAKNNRTTAGQGTTFFVCGEHTLTGTLEMATGGNTQIHRWLGTSDGSSGFITDGTNNTVNINGEGAGSGTDPIFSLEHLSISTLTDSLIAIDVEGGAAVRITRCLIETNDASAKGIRFQGLDNKEAWVSWCRFTGTAAVQLDLDGSAGDAKITHNLFENAATMITITNAALFEIEHNVFLGFTTAALTITGNSNETNASISHNRFVHGSSSIGINFPAGTNIQAQLSMDDNTFLSIGATSAGIDFSSMNASGLCFALSIQDNTFSCVAQSASAYGINGPAGDYVRGSIIAGNIFRDCASGNEYNNWGNGTGNVAQHNLSMDDDGSITQIAVADVGSPVGHVNVVGDLPAHDLLSTTHGDTLAAAVTRGSVPVGNSTPKWAELVLGTDQFFLGSDGTDVLYRSIGWDKIMTPTGSSDAALIQAVIDAGARRILLLDGTWDVSDQNVTFATGTEIMGQSRKATILDFGTTAFFQFLMAADTFVGNATVANAPTSASAPPIQTLAGYTMVWNIDFSSTSGSGLAIGRSTSARAHIINCIFQGLPDAAVGQIEIDAPRFAIIQNCGFLGAASSGAAIFNRHPATASEFFPRPNVVITGCYGTTNCGDGWLDDGGSARETTFSIVGNSIAQAGANAPFAIDISNAIALISGNSFIVPTGQATAAAMINVSGGKVMIENNRLDANSTRTDIIDISTGGHSVLGNLIRGTSTNAIHLTAGNNSVIGGNNCPSGDIRIAGGSTGHVVALNSVNAVVGDATLNQIGLNVTGA